MLYGRSIIVTPYLMLFTVAASMFWLHKGDPVSILPNLIPGATAAFLVSFPLLAVNAYQTKTYLENLYTLIISVVAGAVLLPLMIALFDYLAYKQGLPLYRKAKAAAMDRR
jgi:glucose-6-phosphate-specific signal transduction histidine kinase